MKQILNAFILAGGKSSRMGTDKCLLEYNGRSFLEITFDKLAKTNLFNHIYVNSNKKIEKYDIVSDLIKDKGPLGGIYSCLKFSSTEKNFFIPCDMPLLEEQIIYKLVSLSSEKENIWLKVNNDLFPLVGVFSKKLLAPIESLLSKNNLKVRNLKKYFFTLQIKQSNDISYLNINTPEDYQKLLK